MCVQLRNKHDTPESYYAILEPDAQPHIDQLFHGVATTVESVEPIGKLPRVRVQTHPKIDPDPQDVAFYSDPNERVRLLRVTDNSSDGAVYYYLPREYAGETLTVEIEGLLSRYIQQRTAEVTIPDVNSDSPVDLETHFPTEPWDAAPGAIHPVLQQKPYPNTPAIPEREPSPTDHISTESTVTVKPPETLRDTVDTDRLALWWRPSGVFRSGTIQPVSTLIPTCEARSWITYRGIVQLNDDKGPINVWLPGGEYVVKEQPFVDEIEVSVEGIPTGQSLDRIHGTTLLGWATVQRETFLSPRASDVAESVSSRLYVDGEPVDRVRFHTTQQSGTLCFPILGEHVGRSLTLTLRTWVGGGPAKTTTYTEAASDIELSVTDSDDSLHITLAGQTRRVSDASTTPRIDLSRLVDLLDLSQFRDIIQSGGAYQEFAVESYGPLWILTNEMVLLCFRNK